MEKTKKNNKNNKNSKPNIRNNSKSTSTSKKQNTKNTKNTKNKKYQSNSNSDKSNESSESNNSDSESSEISNIRSKNQKKNQNKTQNKTKQKVQEKKDVYNNIDSDNDVKVKKRDTSDKKISVTKSDESDNGKNILKHKIVVKSDKWTEPQFYNNYRVDLDKPIQSIQKILKTGSSDFPLLKPEVDDSHNTLCIIYNKEEIPIELEPRDDYTLGGIINETNEALDGEDIPIRMKVDKKGFVTIENTQNEKFELDFRSNSIGPYIGFQEQTYKGYSKYTSECVHMFLEQSYFMFIKEISPENAVCEITPDGEVIQLIKDISSNNDIKIRSASSKVIKNFTIQYRYSDDVKSQLVDFYDEPHEITFEIQYATGTSTSNSSEYDSKNKQSSKQNSKK